MFLGEGQPEQAQLGILRPKRAAPALWLGEIRLAFLEGVMVGKQPIDAVLQQPLFFAEIEINKMLSLKPVASSRRRPGSPDPATKPRTSGFRPAPGRRMDCHSPSTAFETMFFMISLVPP
jgi:hypothetical protein